MSSWSAPSHGLPSHFFLRPPDKLFPDPGLMAFTSWCSANRLQTPHPYILLAQASPRLARGPAPCSLDHLALQSAHSYLSIGCPSSNQELPPLRYRSTLPP